MKIITFEQHDRNLKRLQNKDRKEKGYWYSPPEYYEKYLPYRIVEIRPDDRTLVVEDKVIK